MVEKKTKIDSYFDPRIWTDVSGYYFSVGRKNTAPDGFPVHNQSGTVSEVVR